MELWPQKLVPQPVVLVVRLQVTESVGLLLVVGAATSEVPSALEVPLA